jgi:preprotein translocase subunit SecF
MELFRDTKFDFLGKKWPFIIASLLLTVAGVASWVTKGLSYGIDFKGGAEMRVRFQSEPSVDQIRKELSQKIKGEIAVQRVYTKTAPELLIGTEIADENELNQNRETIATALRGLYGGSDAKPDLNNISNDQLSGLLRGKSGIPAAEEDVQRIVTSIRDYRIGAGGIISSIDQLNGQPNITPAVVETLKQETSVSKFAIMSTNVVGPKIGAELRQKAVLATLYALGGMLIYIAFRFEWIYGLAAVIAVFHDTIITIGLFSLTNKEISLTVIAALLTLVGYSMNDTIVVFDRIRENLRGMRAMPSADLINLSINQTLSRTVLTSGLTFLTALALWLFGGPVLEGFSFALVVGILVGTFSSIFIASPILVFWQNYMASRRPQLATARPASIEQSPAKSGDKKKVVRR